MNVRELKGFSELEALYREQGSSLRWPYVFSLPGWMNAWWQHFGTGFKLSLWAIRDKDNVLGVAPFKLHGRTASFIGDASVCDYLDFIVSPGKERAFFEILLGECAARSISRLELSTLRPDSLTLQFFLPFAERHGFKVACREADVSFEMPLPASFDSYLEMLTGKQRRELLRKQRNLEMETDSAFHVLQDEEITAQDIDVFLSLMADSRADKAAFLTLEMQGFFKDALRALSSCSLLRLGFLKLGVKPVAAVLGFDYNNYMYLYNSGYDPAFNGVSVGLISKLAFIRWSIENKKQVFDFLKGPETYKERLGGRRVNLSACSLGIG